jgi:hypothetical protein
MPSKKKITTKKAKKATARRSKPARKKSAPKAVRKPAKKKNLRSKPSTKKKVARKKPAAGKKSRTVTKRAKVRGQGDAMYPLAPPITQTEVEAGDLQGLSGRESADSESVDELLEEGNAFEAGVVRGVQDADNNDEREVHTREVPEDDVPEEYLDED